eukprot:m51a1_g4609 hypothetical protein (477) ;mRNA; f:249946-251816
MEYGDDEPEVQGLGHLMDDPIVTPGSCDALATELVTPSAPPAFWIDSPAAQPISPASVAAADSCAPLPPPRCTHCMDRLDDMRNSSSSLCHAACTKWEANWASSGASCFGACASREFCADHGFPMPSCPSLFPPGERHTVLVYRGTWMQRHERVSDSPPSGSPQEVKASPDGPPTSATSVSVVWDTPGAAECTPGAGCEECVRRAQKLSGAVWARAQENGARVSELITSCRMACQGLCQTSYLCKLHLYAAEVRKEDRMTRFRCPVPHMYVNCRHDDTLAFYCADPLCCNGKWFSRETTHARATRKRVVRELQDISAPSAMESSVRFESSSGESEDDVIVARTVASAKKTRTVVVVPAVLCVLVAVLAGLNIAFLLNAAPSGGAAYACLSGTSAINCTECSQSGQWEYVCVTGDAMMNVTLDSFSWVSECTLSVGATVWSESNLAVPFAVSHDLYGVHYTASFLFKSSSPLSRLLG